ncbi:MAG TPA: hypothetical protein P5096_04110 [Patescibacteria group bacterium]|nr:hypothetical protein [Patescibacteria group bacterium]
MTDQTNPVQPIIPPEEEKLVKDEKEVHDEWMENKITAEKIKDIDTIPELEIEAEKVKLEKGIETLSAPDTTQALSPEPEKIELPPQVEIKDETSPAPQAPSIPEIQEPNKEVVAEIKQEVAAEPAVEVKSEIGKI